MTLTWRQHKELFVQFLGWYEDPRLVYLAMEYFEHGDLAQYMRSIPRICEDTAKEIVLQVLEATILLKSGYEMRLIAEYRV